MELQHSESQGSEHSTLRNLAHAGGSWEQPFPSCLDIWRAPEETVRFSYLRLLQGVEAHIHHV